MKFFVESGAKVETEGMCQQTILQTAAAKGNLPIVTYLLEHGAFINRRNISGKTALYFAITKRHGDVAAYLQQHGGSLCEEKPDVIDILSLAAQYDIIPSFIQLLKTIDVNTKNKDGNTLLHVAAIYGSHNSIEFLLKFGADNSIKNKNGYRASHIVCSAPSADKAMKASIQETIRGHI